MRSPFHLFIKSCVNYEILLCKTEVMKVLSIFQKPQKCPAPHGSGGGGGVEREKKKKKEKEKKEEQKQGEEEFHKQTKIPG